MPESRVIVPSTAEILDRLSIHQLKQVLASPDIRTASLSECLSIEKDLDKLLSEKTFSSAYFIRLLIALGQLNLHIWKTKEVMQSDEALFSEKTKLAHQLNGLRNQIKNKMVAEAGGSAGQKASNVETDHLEGWSISVFEKKSPAVPGTERRWHYLLSDLIDSVTIFQIKEVFFSGDERKAASAQMGLLEKDIDLLLREKNIRLTGRAARLIFLLAQANLHVWINKERMQTHLSEYGALLEFAQEMNGIRNFSRNLLARFFGEATPENQKATFLDWSGGRWYSELLEQLDSRLPDLSAKACLDADTFSSLFGIPVAEIPQECFKQFNGRNLAYRKIVYPEKEEIIKAVLERIDSGELWISGQDKKEVWEKGWRQNLEEYKQSGEVRSLTPKFLGARKILRFNREYVEPEDLNFEFNVVDIYRRAVMKKYLDGADAIYEFGCGSGQHLPVFAELFPGKKIYGMDWAQSSVDLVNQLAHDKGWTVEGCLFDMFSPDQTFSMSKNSAVFTMGAMEQLGENFVPFLEFLIKKGPRCVVHIETVEELYNPENLSDYLAIRYDRKRNYLRGYFKRLLELERQGKIRILKAQRVFFGSLYHDSYSLLAWEVLS